MITMFSLRHGEKIFKGIHLAMAALFLLLSVYIISLNPEKLFAIILWCAVYLVLSFIRHFFLANIRGNIFHWIFPYMEGAVLFIINSIDTSSTGLALYMLHTMDIAVDYDYKYGFVFTIAGYLTYMLDYIQYFSHLSVSMRVLIFIIAAFQFFIYIGLGFLAKKYSVQSGKLQKTSAELHSRMITMEQMTLLKERNRIAGNIHNTVGHQLTTALVQIEAVRMLLDKNPDEVKKRLDIIKEQLRGGLNELRKSIHAINAEDEYEKFDEAVKLLMQQVKSHAGVEVEYEMDDIGEAKLQLKKTLYHVIMESITNAIRHGNCSNIKVKISKKEGTIVLSSFNDGTIPKEVNYGYGLNQMKDSLKQLGGSLHIKINEAGWFGLIAELPLLYKEGESHEQN
jgi:signal transduction histidine kinase